MPNHNVSRSAVESNLWKTSFLGLTNIHTLWYVILANRISPHVKYLPAYDSSWSEYLHSVIHISIYIHIYSISIYILLNIWLYDSGVHHLKNSIVIKLCLLLRLHKLSHIKNYWFYSDVLCWHYLIKHAGIVLYLHIKLYKQLS